MSIFGSLAVGRISARPDHDTLLALKHLQAKTPLGTLACRGNCLAELGQHRRFA